MKRVPGLLAGIMVLTVTSVTRLSAEDWTQFRGGQGGVSDEKTLPVEWSATKNLRWKVALPGRGLSSPIIVGKRVFVTACTGYQQRRLHVLCFDVSDGTKLWERQFLATGSTQCHPTTNMAAPTPVSDGNAVYALFATGDLAALDTEGTLLWYRSLAGDYPDISNQVGLAASPTLWKNVLLLPMENAGESFAAGIDTKTGKNLWKVARPRGINWVSPLVATQGGQTAAIFQTGEEVSAFDPLTGKVLWQLTDRRVSSVASPTQGEGMIFIPGSEFLALRPGKEGGQPEQLWKSPKLSTGYTSPVYYQGKIYGLTSIGLGCLDARTGKSLWVERLEKPFWATPVIADGKAYIANEKGLVVVLKLGDQPTILARNEMEDKFLATPAIGAGSLFLRSDKYLYCVGAAPKK